MMTEDLILHQGVIRRLPEGDLNDSYGCATVCLSLFYTHQVSMCPNGNYARLLSCMCVCIVMSVYVGKRGAQTRCFLRDL